MTITVRAAMAIWMVIEYLAPSGHPLVEDRWEQRIPGHARAWMPANESRAEGQWTKWRRDRRRVLGCEDTICRYVAWAEADRDPTSRSY